MRDEENPTRLVAILEGHHDPDYDPDEYPLVTGADPDDPGSEADH